jgi:hypothetical protein
MGHKHYTSRKQATTLRAPQSDQRIMTERPASERRSSMCGIPVLGYELAVERHDDSTVEASFYVYEGAPNNEAIPLSGHISGKNLSIQGNWLERLIEYPAKKEIVQTHFVKIDGMLDSTSFRGAVDD